LADFSPSGLRRLGCGQPAEDPISLLLHLGSLKFVLLGEFLLSLGPHTFLEICLAELVMVVGALRLKGDGALQIGNGQLGFAFAEIRSAEAG